jgi:uncharacterized NAD(P)/FAD-binding protein YdhS
VAAGSGGGLVVDLADGPRWFGAVVNCSGPGRLPHSADPLTRALLDDGQARIGPYGLGLDIDAAGRVRDRDGRTSDRTWLIGPLRRGVQWETTAVPEIRAQARQVASRIGHLAHIMTSRSAQLSAHAMAAGNNP